jgi:hypothetical protein
MGFPENQPIAMMASSMMRDLPFWVDDRAKAGFDDTVTSGESSGRCGLDHGDMRPLESVPMNVVGDLAKQNSFRLKNSMRFRREWRV